ncbi:hypothetical protein FJU08_22350 [Martelella alba]|uniref:Bacteriophage SP-beta YorD domain-containing protein n=1 Tax=Martelella alba TaxID=2590451 RepID=A0A506TXW8_9HYPH|nr:hypothetical protein [Martelella alba]TPW26350.1 hypothetical protein FJU08_22350 [Martelella alba]
MAFKFTAHEAADIIEAQYPALRNGRDFWTKHPVRRGSAEQIGEVEITEWQPADIDAPTVDDLVTWAAEQAAAAEGAA